MTTWYCRPAGAHGNSQDGTSYDTAWLGWSAVVWGVSGVAGGDTLYLCGTHDLTATVTVGVHGATSGTGKTVIRGDYPGDPGVLSVSVAGVYFNMNRDYTSLRGVKITHTVSATNTCTFANASNIDYTSCEMEKGTTGVNITSSAAKTDIMVDGCHIHDLIGTLGSTGRGVQLQKSTASIVHARLTVKNCTFDRCLDRAVSLVSTDTVWSTSPIHDVTITDNIIRNCGSAAIILLGCPSDGSDHVPVALRATIARNECRDNGTPAGDTGQPGNISVRGWADVLIENNSVWRCTAQGAGIQTAYNRNITIRHNDIREITSGTQTAQFQSGLPIDANGIFFDNFTDGGVAYGNYISDLAGTGHVNSGVGLAFWQARNCRYYGNVVERVQRGCSYGAAEETGCAVVGNTFADCARGVHKTSSTALLGNIDIRNNVFTGADGADYGMYSPGNESASWGYNAISGFSTAYSGFTAGTGDITSDPLLNPDGTLKPGSPCIGAGKTLDIPLLAYDGRPFTNPPSIGAREFRQDEAAVPRRRVDHLSAKYARLDFTNGSVNITPSGHPGGMPTLALQTAGVVSGGVLSIPAGTGGNRTTRIFGNAVVDELMRLDTLPAAERYKCKFFATKIKRYMLTTALATNERLFQYGDQGSDAQNPDGGWVARISLNNQGVMVAKSLTMAIHMAFGGTTKPGAQSDEGYADPILSSRAYTDAEWEAGISVMCAVDCTVSGQISARLYMDGALYDTDTMPVTTWPIPGKSVNGPGNDATSNGLVLFNQSINQVATPTAAHLNHADVWPIWIGEARDSAHLAEIAAALYANPFGNPYSRS